jgi:hypothetical protein
MRFALPLFLALLLQGPGVPLPDSNKFIAEFRKTLRSDDELLRNYTFTEREVRMELDRSGETKTTDLNVYQVFPDRGKLYRRLISRNGIALSQTELEKEDRDQETMNSQASRDDAKIRSELFEIYDIRVQSREQIAGSPTVVLSFRPRPGYKPQSKLASLLTHVSGRVWVNESDHQLVRVDAEVVDPVSYGWFLGSLNQGTRLMAERQKVQSGVWLPARLEILESRRVLLKSTAVHEVHKYSDLRKYN